MEYDVVVIGSGPGGYVAAIRAGQLGMRVALVERERLGGVCLNWGCIPTKALLKSAQVYRYALEADQYGVEVADPRPNFPRMIERSRAVASSMSRGVEFLLQRAKVDVLQGEGAIAPGGRVQVALAQGGTQEITARHTIIATGARSRELPNLKQDGQRVIGYRQALTLTALPSRMVVVGSGAIGSEFAYLYSALGVQVTLVEALPNVLPTEDEEVSKAIERSFKKAGIKIFTASAVASVQTADGPCRVTLQTPKGDEVLEADVVLSAVGITPNLEGLGLEAAGVTLVNGRIGVDPYYRTSAEGIFAIGDVIPGPALAHVASAEAVVCVEAIAGLSPQPINYGNIPSCIYTAPQVASVGLTERAAAEAGLAVRIGRFPFTASGKAAASGHREGFVKLLFHAQHGELLGAHLVGADVTEMIAELVVARALETTAHELIKSIHPHPTLSEAIMEAAAAAQGEAIHG